MKPRYLVVADYPNSELPIGTILIMAVYDYYENNIDGVNRSIAIRNIDKYPHLFKPLQWWEEREVSEIEAVRYLKVVSFDTRAVKQLPIGSFQQVDKCLFDHETKRYQVWVIGHAPIWFAHNFLPATIEQFTNYQKKQNERI